MPGEPVCYVAECHARPDGFAAYCTGCTPKFDRSNEPTGRKQAKCAACGELFTTVRTFDSHQVMKNGRTTCLDPRTMFTRDHKRKLVLTTRGWAKNPELEGFNTFSRVERTSPKEA